MQNWSILFAQSILFHPSLVDQLVIHSHAIRGIFRGAFMGKPTPLPLSGQRLLLLTTEKKRKNEKKKYIVSGVLMAKEYPPLLFSLLSFSLLAILVYHLSPFFYNNILIKNMYRWHHLSFVLLVQCVPRKGFESVDYKTTYKTIYLSLL